MSNTITAYFKGRTGVAESVYQNDYGIVMAFDGIYLPANFDCYFSVPGSDTATAAVGADNRVVIPNSVLGNSGNMSVHIPLHTGSNDSEVEYVAYFKVIGRARPEDDGTPAQMTAIEQALALLQTPIANIEQIVNKALSFTGETFDEMQADLTAWKGNTESGLATWKGGVESDIDDIEHDFTVLQNQFDTAVAAVSTDTERTDIRVGDDEITYTTAGLAVRTQFSDVKGEISDIKPYKYLLPLIVGELNGSTGEVLTGVKRVVTDTIQYASTPVKIHSSNWTNYRILVVRYTDSTGTYKSSSGWVQYDYTIAQGDYFRILFAKTYPAENSLNLKNAFHNEIIDTFTVETANSNLYANIMKKTDLVKILSKEIVISTKSKLIRFPSGSAITADGYQYVLPSATDVTYSVSGSASSVIVFDTLTNTFTAVRYDLFMANMDATKRAVAFITDNDSDTVNIVMDGDYVIDGKGSRSVNRFANNNMLSIAHKGFCAIAPENTRASFVYAKNMGFNWIEADFQYSSDGMVVIHDYTVDRTGNGATGAVNSKTTAQLKEIDFGNTLYPNETILTVGELMQLAYQIDASIFLEGKSAITENAWRTIKTLSARYGVNVVAFSSIDTAINNAVSVGIKKICYAGSNFDEATKTKVLNWKASVDEMYVSFYDTVINASTSTEIAEWCHSNGIKLIAVLSSDSITTLQNLMRYKDIDGQISNVHIADTITL